MVEISWWTLVGVFSAGELVGLLLFGLGRCARGDDGPPPR